MSMDLECWRLHHPSIDKFIYSGDMRTSLAVIRSFQGKFRHARCFSRCLSGGSRIICCTSTSDELFTSRVSKGLYSGSLPTCARQHQCTQGLYPSACSLFDGETLGNRDPRYGTQTEQVYSSSIDQPSTMQKPESTLPGLIQHSAKSVGKSTNIVWQQCIVSRENREELLQQRGCVVWITGLSGSGKSTLACTLDHELCKRGNLSYVLDGDNLRHGLNKNLGFSLEDRAENIRRIGEVAKILVDAGVICIASAISPYRRDRDACRALLPPGEFIEVYMNFPLKLCEERDPKGLYKLAREGKIKGFTGIDDPYEPPIDCEVIMEPIEGKCPTPAEMATKMLFYLEQRGFLGPPRKN